MRARPFALVTIIAVPLLAALSTAPARAGADLNAAERLVLSASHGQARAERVFQGPANLTGVVIQDLQLNKHIIGWIVPGENGGNLLLIGALYNLQGRNDTVAAEQVLGFVPPSPSAAQALAQAESAKGILLGKAGPEIAVFFDPNCVFCKRMYDAVAPYIAEGKLRVKVVPVALVKPDSVAKATSILSAADAAAALDANERAFNFATEEGGAAPASDPSPTETATVRKNTALLFAIDQGRPATPTIVYRDGGEARIQVGMPRDLGQFIAALR